MKNSFWLLPLLFLLVPVDLFGQELLRRNYDVEDGLLSPDLRAISQDNLGFMWFLSDGSVSRFDGTSFKHFYFNDDVYRSVYKDHLGRVWLFGVTNELFYCYNGELHPYAFNYCIDSINGAIEGIHVDQEQTLWLGMRTHFADGAPSFISVSKSGQVQPHYFEGDGKSFVLKRIGNTYLQARMDWNNRQDWSNDSCNLFVVDNDVVQKMKLPNCTEITSNFLNGRILFFSRYDGVFEVGKRYVKKISRMSSISYPHVHYRADGKLMIPNLGNGLYCFDSLDLKSKPHVFLKDFHVSNIFRSDDGSYWFSTRDKGAFQVTSLPIQVFGSETGLPNSRLSDIQITNGSLWISYYDGWISRLFFDAPEAKTRNFNFGGLIFGLFLNPDSVLGIGGLYKPTAPANFPYESFHLGAAQQIAPFSDSIGSYVGGSSIHSWLYNEFPFIRHYIVGTNPISFVQLDREKYVYSHKDSIYTLNSSHSRYLGGVDSLLAQRANSIQRLSQNWLVLATEKNGLVLMKDTQRVYPFTVLNGLSGNNCSHMIKDSDSNLWVLTENGLDQVQYRLRKDTIFLDVVRHFGKEYNVPFPQVKKLVVDDHNIWMMLGNSVIKLPKDLKLVRSAPKGLKFTRVNQGGKSFQYSDSLRVDYNTGITQIDFVCPAFIAPELIRFKYKLDGHDEQWQFTSKRALYYEGLSPGTYTLRLIAIGERPVGGTETSADIQIAPLFWQTLWFRAVSCAIVLVIVLLILYYRFKQLKHRKRLLNEISTHRNTSLRLQMNPHFIYNSLGNMQSFVLKEESRLSSKYITKFSRLMRLIFEYSNREFITLAEELEALKLYIDLESTRKESVWEYELDIDPLINVNSVLIPPMLLQPFVENAVQHGFSRNKKDGLLSVDISRKKGGMQVVISDNGMGVPKGASSIQEQRRRSGGAITFDRITLFNEKYDFDGWVDMKELGRLGTQVTFLIALITTE